MLKISGLHTAIITPFKESGEIDEDGLRQNIKCQIEGDVDGITVLGTTAETPTLSEEEKKRIITIAREEIKGKVSLVVGTGSYSTEQTIQNTNLAKELGADAALIVTPYYNRPPPEGIFQHFKRVSESIDIPIILYNVPGRTGQNINIDTLNRLINIPNIIAIKEAPINFNQITETLALIRTNRPTFSLMSGDDDLTLPLMLMGGQGVFSVVSNLIPSVIKQLVTDIQGGNYHAARDLYFNLLPFVRLAFVESNPIPIKAAMNICGLPAGKCRLPLCDLSRSNLEKMEEFFLNNKYFQTILKNFARV